MFCVLRVILYQAHPKPLPAFWVCQHSSDSVATDDASRPPLQGRMKTRKTDCNETVYATGTVNIRASYTAESDKLGSLSTGDSVTRTGTSVAGTEADGWSRVQLSDGTTAYILVILCGFIIISHFISLPT